ncbi:organic hydroperoxide resistance protein [Oceanobacillus iheyensis HTE831]|uniref:Organic hydroperoxide resistance protein n=1 Tax=Oceanobacillus iheyensis (strain DSM 14371 / CIP 107618 / JCM 11309 / KCTC 3954 / HTE831) TaxID=221109 RepID=Q8ER32_OCEIH|nr:organic hydroperoxide resistance protein [Oceanobacillus iheyensis]BAC13454.1 organic hydroperoxide resistance protein [Oceanobacillus iheyensis HTE831]
MSDILFTSTATAKNGRDGHVKSNDGIIDVELVNPAKGNTDKKGSNPEQLFAAGYSACYDGALNHVASEKGKKISSETTADVHFMKDPSDGGFKIGATLHIKIEGVSQDEAQELAEAAHDFCPYSKATRGNIEVTLKPEAV